MGCETSLRVIGQYIEISEDIEGLSPKHVY